MTLDSNLENQIIVYNHNKRLDPYKELLKNTGVYDEKENIVEIKTDDKTGDSKIDLILNQFKNKYKKVIFDLEEITE